MFIRVNMVSLTEPTPISLSVSEFVVRLGFFEQVQDKEVCPTLGEPIVCFPLFISQAWLSALR